MKNIKLNNRIISCQIKILERNDAFNLLSSGLEHLINKFSFISKKKVPVPLGKFMKSLKEGQWLQNKGGGGRVWSTRHTDINNNNDNNDNNNNNSNNNNNYKINIGSNKKNDNANTNGNIIIWKMLMMLIKKIFL